MSGEPTEHSVSIRERVRLLDWAALVAQLTSQGFAVTEPLLRPAECADLSARFDDDSQYRSTVDMARHRFGDGRYRYFEDPLPATIAALRESFYERLAPIANEWALQLRGEQPTFPSDHAGLLKRCAAAGQTRPTPLILRYGQGDWNALHQDLYGEVYFPLQVLTVLSPPEDYEGGQFVLVEQRPRAQSRAHVIEPGHGAFVIFPTRERPNRGSRGYHRIALRHGVSTITAGARTALGIIFHDAK